MFEVTKYVCLDNMAWLILLTVYCPTKTSILNRTTGLSLYYLFRSTSSALYFSTTKYPQCVSDALLKMVCVVDIESVDVLRVSHGISSRKGAL